MRFMNSMSLAGYEWGFCFFLLCFVLFFYCLLFIVLKDSNGHWPDDGSSENTTPPGLPSGAAWYV